MSFIPQNILHAYAARLTLIAYIVVCVLLTFANGGWHGGLFFVLLLLGFPPFLIAWGQWTTWAGQKGKRAALLIGVLCLITATAWQFQRKADSPQHREIWWREDPALGLRRGWVFREVNSERKVILSTFLKFKKDEVEQIVTRTEATFTGNKDSTEEWRTFKYSVGKVGTNKDGLPFVEISLVGLDAVWIAVLRPTEETMDLYKIGFYVGRYSTTPL